MKKLLTLGLILTFSFSGFTQQVYYNVSAGTGNGLRFWNDDSFKIHMGNTSEYHFGPVYDYSIKTNMSNDSGRGWTWGVHGATPVAGLSNTGHMQIAGDFTANGKLRTNSGNINSGVDALMLMYGDRSDDNNYEWTGFYSGTIRQGIILYDGAWSGANNLLNEFSVTAENGNKLTLNTQGTDIALMPKGGNVGIGTTAPYSKLQINGAGSGNVDLVVNGRIVTGDTGQSGGIWVNGSQTMFVGQNSTTTLGLYNNGAWRLIADNGGNVGIGTTAPDSKLTVKGTIHTQEVKVDLNGSVAPDYVFEKDYPLTSLEGLKAYIDQNKHLPEVPSAKEMEVDGINLKEMNLLLLKKVEELTLYLIELKKENNSSLESLQSQIVQLKKK